MWERGVGGLEVWRFEVGSRKASSKVKVQSLKGCLIWKWVWENERETIVRTIGGGWCFFLADFCGFFLADLRRLRARIFADFFSQICAD